MLAIRARYPLFCPVSGNYNHDREFPLEGHVSDFSNRLSMVGNPFLGAAKTQMSPH